MNCLNAVSRCQYNDRFLLIPEKISDSNSRVNNEEDRRLGFLEYLKKNIMLLDGATGTYLQKTAWPECPKLRARSPDLLCYVQQNILKPDQRRYIRYYGANSYKLRDLSFRTRHTLSTGSWLR